MLMLINALVRTPDELEMRIHLRNEFYAIGFKDIIPELHSFDNGVITVNY